jgi:hypothetical protein
VESSSSRGSDVERQGGRMSLGALAIRKQIPEPEMGCFFCFGSKKLEKVPPKRDNDISGSQVK